MLGVNANGWFYQPTREVYALPDEFGLSYQSVEFGSTDASPETKLHGWFFPAMETAKGTVIHCHGNAGNITSHFSNIAWLPAAGWNVFCFDYQGYGRSAGRPTREGTVKDVHAAIDYVTSRSGLDSGRVLLFGQSLGGAVATVAAAQRNDLRGVVVEGAFSSYQREAAFICQQTWFLAGAASALARGLVSTGLDPIDHVADVAPTPLLFITGTADTICDHQQTLDLHAAAREPKSLWVIENGRHTSALFETNGEGKRRIDEFFTRCVAD